MRHEEAIPQEPGMDLMVWCVHGHISFSKMVKMFIECEALGVLSDRCRELLDEGHYLPLGQRWARTCGA